jgi:hypothetical protein
MMDSITQPAVERRREPRVQLDSLATVHIFNAREPNAGLADSKEVDGRLFDLNSLGAFVATDLVIDPGSKLDLAIDIQGIERPNLLRAEVARTADKVQYSGRISPAGLGLRFLAETQEELERIQRFVLETIMLDLLKYGYETRRTVDFWEDVISKSMSNKVEWQPPLVEGGTHPKLDPSQTISLPRTPGLLKAYHL